MKFELNIKLSVSSTKQRTKQRIKTVQQGFTPRWAALFEKLAPLVLAAIVTSWAANLTGPSKLFAEELVKILQVM
jgi:hypothetical protein